MLTLEKRKPHQTDHFMYLFFDELTGAMDETVDVRPSFGHLRLLASCESFHTGGNGVCEPFSRESGDALTDALINRGRYAKHG